MIPAKELRVDNCVVYHNEIMTIGELIKIEPKNYDLDGTQARLFHLNGNPYDLNATRSTGDLNPLPIERKYLLRMRFEQMGESHYLFNGLMVNLKDGTIIYGDTTIGDIKGFHQLQNHYFDFTGAKLPYDFSEI